MMYDVGSVCVKPEWIVHTLRIASHWVVLSHTLKLIGRHHTHTQTHTHTHTHTHGNIHAHTHTHTRGDTTHGNTHTHIHTHICEMLWQKCADVFDGLLREETALFEDMYERMCVVCVRSKL